MDVAARTQALADACGRLLAEPASMAALEDVLAFLAPEARVHAPLGPGGADARLDAAALRQAVAPLLGGLAAAGASYALRLGSVVPRRNVAFADWSCVPTAPGARGEGWQGLIVATWDRDGLLQDAALHVGGGTPFP